MQRSSTLAVLAITASLVAAPALATGLATCGSRTLEAVPTK